MKGRQGAIEHFLGKAIRRELKKWKAGEIEDLSWLTAISSHKHFWLIWEGISAKVNADLKGQGLWHRDDDSVVVPEENGIPSLKKRKSFALEASPDADESIYDPEALDEIYLEARIAEDDEITEEAAETTPCVFSRLGSTTPKRSQKSGAKFMRMAHSTSPGRNSISRNSRETNSDFFTA